MHHERQEWAAHHYPMTEQGLLDRFNPRPKSPSQTSPTPEEDTQMQTASCEPANVQSPSSAQPAPPLSQSPTSAPELESVSSVGALASPAPQSSLCSLPAIGRGFLLQLPPAHNPGESPGVRAQMKPSQPSSTPPQSKNTFGLSVDISSLTSKSLSSSIRQSFTSFRN